MKGILGQWINRNGFSAENAHDGLLSKSENEVDDLYDTEAFFKDLKTRSEPLDKGQLNKDLKRAIEAFEEMARNNIKKIESDLKP